MSNPNISTLAIVDDQEAGRATQKAIRAILREAVEIKGIALEVIRQLQEPFKDDEQAERARIRAQAVTSVAKAYSEAVMIINIERGKPLPGSLRPEKSKPKHKRSDVSFVPVPTTGSEPDSKPA